MRRAAFIMLVMVSLLALLSCGDKDARLLPDRDVRPGLKLDGAAYPHYRMNLSLSRDLTSFSGDAALAFTNTGDKPLSSLMFRLYPNALNGSLAVSKVSVNGAVRKDVAAASEDPSVFELGLGKPLLPGTSIKVFLGFSGTVPADGGGHGFIRYKNGVLLLPYSFPLLAPFEDGTWQIDPPSFPGDPVAGTPAWYTVVLRVPEGFNTASSGIITEETSSGQEKILRIEAGPGRDFFLAVSDSWGYGEYFTEGVMIRSWYPREAAEYGREVQETARKAITLFSSLLGPYPYNEFEIVGGPTKALGVEYPGIIVINQDLYGEDEYAQGIPNSRLLEATVVHEAAHQWFYNLVGSNQMKEPWIDEALAQYLTLYFYRETGGLKAEEEFRQTFFERWDRVGRKEVPIDGPVTSFTGGEYSSIIYGRAPLFLEELEETMGSDGFAKFLKNLVAEYAWRILDTDEFLQFAKSQTKQDLTALYDAWFDR